MVSSMGYKPALIIVQNKWDTDGMDIPPFDTENNIFDVTHEYAWLVKNLQGIDGAGCFSRVFTLRVALGRDHHLFEDSLFVLHNAVQIAMNEVQKQRERAACLYLERGEFWFLFEKLVEQTNVRGLHDTPLMALSEIAQVPFGSDHRCLDKSGSLCPYRW